MHQFAHTTSLQRSNIHTGLYIESHVLVLAKVGVDFMLQDLASSYVYVPGARSGYARQQTATQGAHTLINTPSPSKVMVKQTNNLWERWSKAGKVIKSYNYSSLSRLAWLCATYNSKWQYTWLLQCYSAMHVENQMVLILFFILFQKNDVMSIFLLGNIVTRQLFS